MIRKLLPVVILLVVASVVGWVCSKVERRIANVESHAMSNSMQLNRVAMGIQMFYEMAPDEMARIARSVRCQCGQDTFDKRVASVEADDAEPEQD